MDHKQKLVQQQTVSDGSVPKPSQASVARKFKEPFGYTSTPLSAGAQGVTFGSTQGRQKEKVLTASTDKKIGGIDVAASDRVAKAEGDEYWESYAREIELEKEILEMGGIEKVEAGEVAIPPELAKEMGIQPIINEQSPISKVTGFSVRGVALDDSQLAAGLVKPTSSGFRWLVEWFIYQLLKARYIITRVKGRVTREKPQGN